MLAEIGQPRVLALLKEVNVADIIGEEPEGEASGSAAELATVELRVQRLEEQLVDGDEKVGPLMGVLRILESKRQDLMRRLSAAKQREANPQSAAWTEVKSLLDVAQDEAQRQRLRDVLRSIIKDVWVLVVPRRSHRLAAAQVNFREGERRDYLIHYKAAGNGRKGGWSARSLAEKAPGLDDLDLGNRKDALDLEKALNKIDLENFSK
jgi:hypothetical protein